MSIKTQQILSIIILIMVILDSVYIYAESGTFNALYIGATLILFGFAWDSLKKLKSHQFKSAEVQDPD